MKASIFCALVLTIGAPTISAQDPAALIHANYEITLEFEGSVIHLCDSVAQDKINGYTLNAMNEIMQDYRNDIGADLVFDKVETESQDVVHRRALADKDKSLITFGPVPNWVKLFAKSRFECGKLGNPKCPYVLVITGDCCCRCRIPEIIIDDGIRTLRRVPHKKEATTLVGKMEMELTQKMGLALSNDIASKRFKCLDGVTGVTAHLAKKD